MAKKEEEENKKNNSEEEISNKEDSSKSENSSEKEISQNTSEIQSNKEDKAPKTPSATQKIRKNPWILATLVLGILVILLLVSSFAVQEDRYTKSEIKEMSKDFFEKYGREGISVNSVKESNKSNSLYRLEVGSQGQTVPFYITKSGYLVGSRPISIVPNDDGSYNIPGAGSLRSGDGGSNSKNTTLTTQ